MRGIHLSRHERLGAEGTDIPKLFVERLLTFLQTPRLYNAANTDDVRHAINWLREKYPENKLFAAGFSLGSQLLVIALLYLRVHKVESNKRLMSLTGEILGRGGSEHATVRRSLCVKSVRIRKVGGHRAKEAFL